MPLPAVQNFPHHHPHHPTTKVYYTAFDFCGVIYSVGEFVYLTPENAEAPLYLARVISAFEDTRQAGGDRLCIEVQWYERRANMPAQLQEGMHEREVAEWLQTDTNLVGCIERKARVLRARSYEDAAAQLDPADVDGEWHFCRGALDTETMEYRTYDEVEAGGRRVLFAQGGAASRPLWLRGAVRLCVTDRGGFACGGRRQGLAAPGAAQPLGSASSCLPQSPASLAAPPT